jgi:hypothetical protein
MISLATRKSGYTIPMNSVDRSTSVEVIELTKLREEIFNFNSKTDRKDFEISEHAKLICRVGIAPGRNDRWLCSIQTKAFQSGASTRSQDLEKSIVALGLNSKTI